MLAKSAALCPHCGLTVAPGNIYCCRGCESVHSLLLEKGLGRFYTLREKHSFAPPAPVIPETAIPSVPKEGDTAQFYIEGIHCLGCLWLLEKLPEIESGIRHSNLDTAHHILTVTKTKEFSWRETVRLIRRLGYRPKALENGNADQAKRIDLRRQLIRIGIAGFSAGNIMLLSVSVYAGTDPLWSLRFGWLSFILALPTLLYSAWPLYRSALLPLREGRVSVDLPIALALLAGSSISLWSLLLGSGKETYFDSLTSLVFLLLGSRFLLQKLREDLSREAPCLSLLSGEAYETDRGPIDAEDLAPGDLLELNVGQTVPTDGRLLSPEAYLDFSLLTGESLPIKRLEGDLLEAGAKTLSSFRLQVNRPASESRLAKILEQIHTYEIGHSSTRDMADRMGRYFTMVSLSLALFLAWWIPGEEGLKRALALVIVTCPCVLAFALPLALTRAMQIAARRGILFVSPEKIEALAEAEEVFFDKTGTLTEGKFEVLDWKQISGEIDLTLQAVQALEKNSAHPVGKALARFTSEQVASPAMGQEIAGRGVEGTFKGENWFVGRSAFTHAQRANIVSVEENGRTVAEVALGDSLRPEAKAVIAKLRGFGLKLRILSGDTEANVAQVAATLGINDWHSLLSPEEKADAAAKASKSVLVGDGANDAVALRGASVGVAMQGSVDLCLKKADVLLTSPGLSSLPLAFSIARNTMRVVRTNFAITLAYNIFAGSLAVSGSMEPLWAAVLMPSSALTVFLFTQWQSRRGIL